MAWLDETDVTLFQRGLIHRHDVLIQINHKEVARGYSRPGCPGMLLVTQLPHAAVSWADVAPKADLSNFSMRYIYEGELYDRPPALRRFMHWLKGTLPGFYSVRSLVIGLAESGHCHLMHEAIALLTGMGGEPLKRRIGT